MTEFKKEAKEYANKRAKKLCINECNLAYATMERAYQKGAEFGYNKAKEEAKIIIKDLLNNSDEYARQRAMDFLKKDIEK